MATLPPVTLDSPAKIPLLPVHQPERDRLAESLLYLQILGVCVFQKVGFTIGGSQLYVGMVILLGTTLLGVLTRRLRIHGTQLALYLCMVGVTALTQLLGGFAFSVPSLAFLYCVHLPYIFTLQKNSSRPYIELAFYQQVMTFIACAGILQFGLQFVIGWKLAFFLDTQIPSQFIMQGFHWLNPVKYHGTIFKSNGIFMLEPAMFCQFLAISIIVEMAYFKRAKRILLFNAAILTTFSGTGLIILAVLVPIYLFSRGRYLLLVAVGMALVLLIVTAPFIGLDAYVSRVGEFSSTKSSGFARFLSNIPILFDRILPQTNTLLFGRGAGSMREVQQYFSFETASSTWGKFVYEYGLTGTLAYLLLMAYIFGAPPRSPYLKAALVIQFVFLAEYILAPTVHGLVLALLTWPKPPKTDTPPAPA
jgi:hypothetical protein